MYDRTDWLHGYARNKKTIESYRAFVRLFATCHPPRSQELLPAGVNRPQEKLA